MTKIILQDTNSGHNLQTINDNFRKIEDEFNKKVLYRDNPVGEPNEMQSDLDMNGKRIYNLPAPIADHEPARKKDVGDAPLLAKQYAEEAKGWAETAEDTFNDVADALLEGTDYLGEYLPNLVIDSPLQFFWRDGAYYRISGDVALPYTTTGDWGDEEGLFVEVGDQSLRQEITDRTDPLLGAAMVGRAAVVVDTISELLSIPAGARREDLAYIVKSFHSGTQRGGGIFLWDQSKADENDGGLVISGFVRTQSEHISPFMFGAHCDGVSDDTEPLQRMLDAVPEGHVIDLVGAEFFYDVLHVPKSITIRNGGLISGRNQGTQITVAPYARLDAHSVRFSGGGNELTYILGHRLISQVGESTSERGVGMRFESCVFDGAGESGVFAQFSDGIVFSGCLIRNTAYAGLMFLSCNHGVLRGNRFENQNSVGSSPGANNAYSFAITHDNSNYSDDPNAGSPQADNPFSAEWVVTENTVIAPKIWEGIDFHGSYGSLVAHNKIYGAATGIVLGTGSNDAANYAGYDNVITGNLITSKNEDGTAIPGLAVNYGIVVNGGAVKNHSRVIVTDNIIDGYGGGISNLIPAIRVDQYVEDFVVSGNVIKNWTGTAIGVSTGAGSGVISNNVMSGMRESMAQSTACVRLTGNSPGRYQIIGNVLGDKGVSPTYGLLTSNAVTGHITYGSDFRRAETEIGGTVAATGSRRLVSYT